MTDCQNHIHADAKSGGRRLFLALCVIVAFMIVEVVGGLIAGSLALLADAAHMFTDAMALALAASAHWLSRRPASPTMHFGYRRAQVIAAFVNGVALVALLTVIFVEAMRRFADPTPVSWRPMLIVAVLGLLANIAAFALLHGSTIRNNINVRGAMLHIAADMLGSVAAIIGAIVIMTTGWVRIDPILSALVALLIARSAIRLLRETSHILLEGAPPNLDVAAMVADLMKAAPGLEDIHHVQVSQITPDHPRLTMHARLREGASTEVALEALKSRLAERFSIADSTIQLEFGVGCPDESPGVARSVAAMRSAAETSHSGGTHFGGHDHGRHTHNDHHEGHARGGVDDAEGHHGIHRGGAAAAAE